MDGEKQTNLSVTYGAKSTGRGAAVGVAVWEGAWEEPKMPLASGLQGGEHPAPAAADTGRRARFTVEMMRLLWAVWNLKCLHPLTCTNPFVLWDVLRINCKNMVKVPGTVVGRSKCSLSISCGGSSSDDDVTTVMMTVVVMTSPWQGTCPPPFCPGRGQPGVAAKCPRWHVCWTGRP